MSLAAVKDLTIGTRAPDTGLFLPHFKEIPNAAIRGTIGNIWTRIKRTVGASLDSTKAVAGQTLDTLNQAVHLRPIETVKAAVGVPFAIAKEIKGMALKTLGGSLDFLTDLGRGALGVFEHSNLTIRNAVKKSVGTVFGETAKRVVGLPTDLLTYTIASQIGHKITDVMEGVSNMIAGANEGINTITDKTKEALFKTCGFATKTTKKGANLLWKTTKSVGGLLKEIIAPPPTTAATAT